MNADLLILGGGITGLGVARLAARNGLTVVLAERDDLAAGASSASSHMLHGGLRYLETGQFRLVREALAERVAVSRMAPTLARPVRFLVPLRRGGRLSRWKLRAGLGLYDALAGRARLSPHAMAGAADSLALEPGLAADGLLGAGLYGDVVMDDARLAIAVARDAAAHGATILTRTELATARMSAGEPGVLDVVLRDRETRADLPVRVRAIVNATGAWSDRTRRELARMLTPGRPDPAPVLRPSRGAHLVYPALTRGHGVVVTAASDGRVFFVVPFAGRSLVGTTEVETSSPPSAADLAPSSEEIRYLATEVARVLPGAAGLAPLALMCGIRPLLAGGADGAIGGASREHGVFEDGPVITLAGGKYTTFRVMARDALAVAVRRLGRQVPPIVDEAGPLPAPPADDTGIAELTAHACEWGFARHLDDVLRRRTRLWLGSDGGLAAAPEAAEALARRLGWAPERQREELDAWESKVREERGRIARALAPAAHH